ncbi:gp21 prohead core scaffold protease [Synechococcus phage metaG-MbCM1]|uniref:Gp21 prohead core scaffold protease n=1 Tax=Synechococcus phage metaG-MbCM1 TaxID=1079999 RepID=H8ZNA8_9CAUD|nr:head maturation protease [Synechococcus phage metaG-MbCM1]AFD02969.1 gp21 prohead core scaffold protease [Synechococcus phage metaG-MbCM1]
MRLIAEEINQVDFLCEEKEGKKNYFIEGVFLQAELKNRNNRMYPLKTLTKEVAKYDENYIQKGRALGELGHPDGPSINLDRVSHKILSLREDGNNFIGRAKLLDTPMGKVAKSLLDEGVKLGVSSRGMGSIRKEDNCNVVMDDFMLATAADIVADPSAPDAFVNGIMEGKEWVWDNGILKESAVALFKTEIDHATLRNLQERKVSAFETFLKRL